MQKLKLGKIHGAMKYNKSCCCSGGSKCRCHLLGAGKKKVGRPSKVVSIHKVGDMKIHSKGGRNVIKDIIDKILSPITKPITNALLNKPVARFSKQLKKGGRVSTKAEVEKANKKFAEKYNKKFGERDLLRQDEALLEQLDFEGTKEKQRQESLKKSKLLQSNPKLREAYKRSLDKENVARYEKDVALKKAQEEEKMAQKMQFKTLEEELKFWEQLQKQAEQEGDIKYADETQKTINDILTEIEQAKKNKASLGEEILNVATRGLIKGAEYIPVIGKVASVGAEKLYEALPKKEYKYDALAKKAADVGVSKLASVLGSAKRAKKGGELKASYDANINRGGKRKMSEAQKAYQQKLKMIRNKYKCSFKEALQHYKKMKHKL